MKTTSNLFKAVIQDHILSYYGQDMGYENQDASLNFCNEVKRLTDGRSRDFVNYHTTIAKGMTYGGCFLIYNSDIVDFYVKFCQFDRVRLDKLSEQGKLLDLYANNLARCGNYLLQGKNYTHLLKNQTL